MLGLSDLARVYGREVYIIASPTVEQLFQGVTLTVYQEVQRLFCSPVFRSHRIVRRILSKLAEEAQVSPPSPEATWAICGYLNTACDERIGPCVVQSDAQWYVGQVLPDVVIASGTTRTSPKITCIIDEQFGRAVAFHQQKVGESLEEPIAVALYVALCAQRQPTPFTPGGLVWSLPRQIIADFALPQDAVRCCTELGASLGGASARPKIFDDLEGAWARTLSGRVLSTERFELMLETYLKKRYGYGPRTTADDADYAFRHLEGYNRDPALVLPPLRWLLPAYDAIVNEDAVVTVAGRRYHDDLLRYWPGAEVTVRVSRHDRHFAYIYLDGEILCVAFQAV
jgi:hypothetical protein